MTVRSKTHEAKWQEGLFNLIVPRTATFEEKTASEIDALSYKVPYVDADDFWAYKLEFNSAAEGYYHSI
jgi:hypothetical protein